MGELLLTVVVGLVGGILMMRLKVPGGMMLGSIMAVSIFNVLTGNAYMPGYMRILAQIAAGAYIGCMVEKKDFIRLKQMWKPALWMLGSLLFVNIAIGVTIWMITPLDLLTSLFCGVPGGISDTPLIAADMGADTPKVAVMMFVRSFAGMGLFPALILLTDRVFTHTEPNSEGECAENDEMVSEPMDANKTKASVLTLFVAGISGYIGWKAGIPAGALQASIIGVLCLKLIYGYAYLPNLAKRIAQLLTGSQIGCMMGYNDFIELRYMLLPAVILVTFYFLNCFFTGYIISRRLNFTRKEGMLITTPAGATDIALLIADIGVRNPDVAILQIIRLLVAVTVFPHIIRLIVMLV